jgi:hypothetical protein
LGDNEDTPTKKEGECSVQSLPAAIRYLAQIPGSPPSIFYADRVVFKFVTDFDWHRKRVRREKRSAAIVGFQESGARQAVKLNYNSTHFLIRCTGWVAAGESLPVRAKKARSLSRPAIPSAGGVNALPAAGTKGHIPSAHFPTLRSLPKA